MALKKEKKNFTYEVEYLEDAPELTEEEKKAKRKETILISLLVIAVGLILIPLVLFLYNWRVMK